MGNIGRLRSFVQEFGAMLDATGDAEALVLERGSPLLGDLVSHDDWLPAAFAKPDPHRYQQFLLHCDPAERFSVVSFVWGPGQTTPVHDHTVWGMIGVLRGAEICEEFIVQRDPASIGAAHTHKLGAGQIDLVSPRIGDVHRVSNALTDRESVSIHVYGANIGAVRRNVFDPVNGVASPFISGYSSDLVPNLWDRSGDSP